MRRSVISLLALAMFTACAPQAQPVKPAVQPPQLKDFQFIAADGETLPMRRWLPPGKPRALLVALHGFNDYSNAFERTGNYFKAHGVAVFAYDQRGFGETGARGLWGSQDNMTSDVRQVIERLQIHYPNTPVYVLGESMGGAVAIVAAAQPDFPEIQGIILEAPAVWGMETMNPFYRLALWIGAHSMPYHTLTGSGLKIIASNNYPMLSKLAADPHVIKETRIDAIYGMVHLMDSAYDALPRLRQPVLMLYGARDQVIPRAPIERAAQRLQVPLTFADYPDGFHMLLRDIQYRQVLDDIANWMDDPHGALPSGFTRGIEPPPQP